MTSIESREPHLPTEAQAKAAGFRLDGIRRACAVIERFVSEEKIPGATATFGSSQGTIPPIAIGRASLEPWSTTVPELPIKVNPDTIYDCASLTKVVAVTPLVLMMIDEGLVRLRDAVTYFIPEFVKVPKLDAYERALRQQITLFHLLTHTSGLASAQPLYRRAAQEGITVLDALYQAPLAAPPGEQVIYNCLGFILLGEVIERVLGMPIDSVASQRIFKPLGMVDTQYTPDKEKQKRIAPTEVTEGQLLHGVVHDENARAMGGISGNAGLFSTAKDLARFAQLCLSKGTFDGVTIFSPLAHELAVKNHTPSLNEPRGLGWQLRGGQLTSSAGDLFSAKSFGHTGFTGTSLWVDPERDLFAVLLCNRVHPTRNNDAHVRLRPLFHNAVAAARM